jgi:hypothetical protein
MFGFKGILKESHRLDTWIRIIDFAEDAEKLLRQQMLLHLEIEFINTMVSDKILILLL